MPTVRVNRRSFLAAGAMAGAAVTLGKFAPVYDGPPVAVADQRAAALVKKMTFAEKIAMVHGTPSDTYIGYVPGVRRLGIPALLLTDGPAGIRTPKQQSGPSTAFPAPIALAASFDAALARQVGTALGSEAKAKKQNVVFAPIVNLARVPEGGRLFEGFGEDPVLTSVMGREVTLGIQAMGVIATVKHWICNDQEDSRHLVSADVDERTLREVYLPPFISAIRDGKAGSVMAANNGANGSYNAQNAPLLRTLLKDELGFQGYVCSDYAATHDPVLAANGGLDLDLPTADHFGTPLATAVRKGTVSVATLDDKVHRILRTMIALGIVDGKGVSTRGGKGAANTAAHIQLAQDVAERGAVLLKNATVGGTPLLPLDPNGALRIAAVGPYAATARIGGDGSSFVRPLSSVSPVSGIEARFAAATVSTAPGAYADYATVPTDVLRPAADSTAHGLLGEYFANTHFSGDPKISRVDPVVSNSWGPGGPGAGIPGTNWSARWTGVLTPATSGSYTLASKSDDDSRVYLDGKLTVDNSGEHENRRRTAVVDLVAGHDYAIRVDYIQRTFRANVILQWILPADDLIATAAQTAANADVAIVFVSDLESEGIDRENLSLPGQQDQLIAAVAQANPHCVVVSNAGGPILMPWIDKVPAVLVGWYAGERDGAAVARLLAGDVSPAGRLPVTFGRSEADYPARRAAHYPGVPAGQTKHQPGLEIVEQYSEGTLIGYRHFDASDIDPLFCFGHGLSYTQFAYGAMHIERVGSGNHLTVEVTIRNAGSRAADEVVQLYVGVPQTAGEPVRVLRDFERIHLAAGASEVARFVLTDDDFARWSTSRHEWAVVPGRYEVAVGASSRDLRDRQHVNVR